MKAIVDISGGFGNQLFQFSFSIFLQKRGYDVYINDQENLSYFDPKILKIKSSSNLQHKLIQLSSNNKIFQKLFCDYYDNNSDLTNIIERNPKKYITFLNGYWQKNLYVNENEKKIQELIDSAYLKHSLTSKELRSSNSALIHVRRTDYIKNGEILSLNYYENSMSYLKTKKISDFYIFTDDNKWVKNQKIFSKAIHIEETPKHPREIKNTLQTFYEMQKFQNFIISNSTFSWWAAKLSNLHNGYVVCPTPFFLKEGNYNLYDSNWELIRR